MGHSFPPHRIEIRSDALIDSIARDKAVVFAGAGASIPVGLPTWKEFLQSCFDAALQEDGKSGSWTQTKAALRRGDNATAAELLQRALRDSYGSQLDEHIWRAFGRTDTPSRIHRAISKIPFSLAITTNYDDLLESAYDTKPPVFTWDDANQVVKSIKRGRFAVVKTHGDVYNRKSLVLTKTQYRDLINNRAFNQCLQMLLTTRTFLFVGSSLRDHDVLGLMDETRLLYGEDFGPHYAILFEDEVDSRLLDYLRGSRP